MRFAIGAIAFVKFADFRPSEVPAQAQMIGGGNDSLTVPVDQLHGAPVQFCPVLVNIMPQFAILQEASQARRAEEASRGLKPVPACNHDPCAASQITTAHRSPNPTAMIFAIVVSFFFSSLASPSWRRCTRTPNIPVIV
jgi:hypothetical protein